MSGAEGQYRRKRSSRETRDGVIWSRVPETPVGTPGNSHDRRDKPETGHSGDAR